MPLLNDAKQFVREMVTALEGGLYRIDRKDPGEQLFLASQLIGSCDSLTAVLLWFGNTVPKMQVFSEHGREKLAEIRKAARIMRSNAYRDVCDAELPAEEPEVEAEGLVEVDADGAIDIGEAKPSAP